MLIRTTSVIALTCAASATMADAPRVATDIAPVTALVNSVMAGVGTADPILPKGASPHDFDLRPSEAQVIANADVVVWVGHGLTPWLESPIEALAPNATVIELLEQDEWPVLPARTEEAIWSAGEDHDDHGDHDEHDDHGEHDDHDDHGDHDDHDDHDHGENDPHAWLSPWVMAAWADILASELASLDPQNADIYRANAAKIGADMTTLKAEITAILAPVAGGGYVVSHDALQYFETAFDMPAAGAIALSDAAEPGAAHIAELRDLMQKTSIRCVLADAQTNPDWAAIITEGTDAKTAVIDPALWDGAADIAAYAESLRNVAQSLQVCLAQ